MRWSMLAMAWFVFAGTGNAGVLEKCRVVKVIDDNHFEEGLSTHEYPDIDVGRNNKGLLEVSVGATRDWEQGAGDFVSFRTLSSGTQTKFRYKNSRSTYTFTVTRNGTGRRSGRLSVLEPNEYAKLIAIAYCK